MHSLVEITPGMTSEHHLTVSHIYRLGPLSLALAQGVPTLVYITPGVASGRSCLYSNPTLQSHLPDIPLCTRTAMRGLQMFLQGC